MRCRRSSPVLARVQWIAQQTPARMPEPQEMRRRAFHGLKTLLFRIAERRPLIVLLDNLQWGDVDSARLQGDLLAPPGVPPFLLISAYRRDEASPMLRDLGVLRAMVTPAYALRAIETPALSLAGATRLALRLCGGAPSPKRDHLARRIAQEAAGNPATIHALVEELERPGRRPRALAGAERRRRPAAPTGPRPPRPPAPGEPRGARPGRRSPAR